MLSDARLIAEVAGPLFEQAPFRFAEPYPGAVLTTLENQGRFLTVIANPGPEACQVTLLTPADLKSQLLWGDDAAARDGRKATLQLPGRATTVLLWDRR